MTNEKCPLPSLQSGSDQTLTTDPRIGTTLEIKWGTSRGRDSYGYATCSIWHNGRRIAACNGGGYDMRGTVVGDWITRTFRAELLALPLDRFPKRSHWERDENPPRLCESVECLSTRLPADTLTCPICGGDTRLDHRAGRTVQDGPGFYGLTYHDPNYDPGQAVIGTDCSDRTLGDSSGETVAEAEAAGKSLGLERYQAAYAASSKVPTPRHTIPSIDGASGLSCVLEILKVLGFSLRQIVNTKRTDVYIVERASA